MKADKIIRNAKIFTSNKDNLQATALAVGELQLSTGACFSSWRRDYKGRS